MWVFALRLLGVSWLLVGVCLFASLFGCFLCCCGFVVTCLCLVVLIYFIAYLVLVYCLVVVFVCRF